MDRVLENKVWWAIYNEVGVHPDEYDIDFSTPESVEASLKSEIPVESEGWGCPRSAKPDQRYKDWLVEVVENSHYVDKDIILNSVVCDPAVMEMWENCEPSDSPQMADVLYEALGRPSLTIVV